jgi:hypothetical protein
MLNYRPFNQPACLHPMVALDVTPSKGFSSFIFKDFNYHIIKNLCYPPHLPMVAICTFATHNFFLQLVGMVPLFNQCAKQSGSKV